MVLGIVDGQYGGGNDEDVEVGVGYTIAIRARTSKLRDVMLEFLAQEFRPWSRLVPELGPDAVGEPTTDLSYDDGGPTTLGFDYSSWIGNWERRYIYTVLHWVALKVGEIRDFPEVEFSDRTKGCRCPYVVYDGSELFPCLLFRDEAEVRGKLSPRWHSSAVNSLGVYVCPDLRLYSARLEGEYEEAIEGELKRLDGLWTERAT